jgi:hypothetical protein
MTTLINFRVLSGRRSVVAAGGETSITASAKRASLHAIAQAATWNGCGNTPSRVTTAAIRDRQHDWRGSAQLYSFRGTAEVPAATAKMRLVQLADEIISVLCSDPNATVNVVVEIDAKFSEGSPDHVKRAVSENATTLGLKNVDWE